jgi:hypothetical protein
MLRRSDSVSSSFILFRKYPRFRKTDQVSQEVLDPLWDGKHQLDVESKDTRSPFAVMELLLPIVLNRYVQKSGHWRHWDCDWNVIWRSTEKRRNSVRLGRSGTQWLPVGRLVDLVWQWWWTREKSKALRISPERHRQRRQHDHHLYGF